MHGAADRLIHRGLSLTEYTARSNAEEQYDEEVPVHSGLFIMNHSKSDRELRSLYLSRHADLLRYPYSETPKR
jgi:hypothetical protein